MTGKSLAPALVALALLSGCTKETGPAEGVRAPEPPTTAWEGIYQGPYHIYLRLVTEGTHASGTWQAMGERTGEFSGEITGDILNFYWTERFRDDTWSGRGYFVYGPARVPGKSEIRGQWGLGNRNTGGSWWAIKRSDLPLTTQATALMDAGTDDNGEQKSGNAATAEPEAFED